jgi:phosphatidate cytidylyltransferase
VVSRELTLEAEASAESRPRDRELGRRLLAAAVLIPPVIGLVWLGGLPFAVGVAIVAALASFEFFRLALGPLRADAWLAVIASAALPVLPSSAPRWGVAAALVLGVSILSWSWNALRGDAAQGGQRASALVSGTVFCGGSLLALPALRELEQGRAWVLCLLAAAAANDAAAYFGGRRFGRHHLAPRVSPGKTWEGWWCGLVGALAVAEAGCLARLVQLSWKDAAVVAILASVFGPLGDLSKSLLKRVRGVKTSGHLIPGHGGVLDRVDSALFTGPVVLLYATFPGG